MVWQSIADKISALGVAQRTAKEVKDKWGNTKKAAKRVFAENRKESSKTGGGPKPKPVSATIEKVIEMCKDSCSFKGIGGVETEIVVCDENDVECPEDTMDEEVFESAHSQIQEDVEESLETAPSSPVLSTQHSPSILMPTVMPRLPLMGRPGTSHSSPVLATQQSPSTVMSQLPRISRPGTSKSRLQSERRNKKTKITVEDVHRLQYEVLQKELVNQDLKRKKLNLQISFLEKLNKKSCPVDRSPTFSQVWETMMN